jgi:hypothetical protein
LTFFLGKVELHGQVVGHFTPLELVALKETWDRNLSHNRVVGMECTDGAGAALHGNPQPHQEQLHPMFPSLSIPATR